MYNSMIKTLCLTAAAFLLSPLAYAAPELTKLVDLDARVIVETRNITLDGVTRTSNFEDSMMRRGSKVWKVRLNLQNVAHEHGHTEDTSKAGSKADVKKKSEKKSEKFGHDHFNPIEYQRVVTLENGAPALSYISPERKMVVTVPKAEFDNVGFDGSWDRSYYLITAQDLARLKPTDRQSPVAGAVWYERSVKGTYERVLWDSSRLIPLIMESGSSDGKNHYKITVKATPAAERNPSWLQTKQFEQRSYVDYLD